MLILLFFFSIKKEKKNKRNSYFVSKLDSSFYETMAFQQVKIPNFEYTANSMSGAGLKTPRFLNDQRQRFFVFDSRQRQNFSTTDSDNIRISLPETISQIKTMCLEYFTMPNGIYNITAALTNDLLYVTQGGSYVITIPDGAYDTSTLISTLTSLLDTATGNTWTITLSPITLKLTFTATGPAFSFDFTQPGTVFHELGFDNFVYTSSGSPESLTAPEIMQLQGITEIFINVNEYESTLFSSSMNANFCVPILTNTGGQIFYLRNSNIEQSSFFNSYSNKYNTFNIQLLDSQGRFIQTNGCEYIMMVSVSYYD